MGSWKRTTGGLVLVSVTPKHKLLLCCPFMASVEALKPAHDAVHTFTSNVMMLTPQSTVRSLFTAGNDGVNRQGQRVSSTIWIALDRAKEVIPNRVGA